jgi:hypothetical protein
VAWILLGALVVSGTFFLMVLRQVLQSEERLRVLVMRNEARIARRFHAKMVVPGDEEGAQP